jgi:hypothetical protein
MTWQQILRPDVLWVVVPLAAILVLGINGGLAQYHRHRERLAMIEQGIDPDARKDRQKV